MLQYSFELFFLFLFKKQSIKQTKPYSVQTTSRPLHLPGCLSTVPYACSQVDGPVWLLEFRGAIFVV